MLKRKHKRGKWGIRQHGTLVNIYTRSGGGETREHQLAKNIKGREYSRITIIWTCLRGGDEKCSHNSSRESNLTQPVTLSGI